MDDKKLNKLYLSAVRSRKKSGARWQKVTEVQTNKTASDSYSPYRNFVEGARGGMEPDLAVGREFPRQFSITTAIRNDDIAAEVKGRVHALLGLAPQILTERQYAVFILIAVKDPPLTEREIAKVLSISPGRVNQLRKTAMEKLRRAYDERTA